MADTDRYLVAREAWNGSTVEHVSVHGRLEEALAALATLGTEQYGKDEHGYAVFDGTAIHGRNYLFGAAADDHFVAIARLVDFVPALTNAPQAYDFGYLVDVGGRTSDGWREVYLPRQYVEHQTSRNASGGYALRVLS